jgi:gluconate 2-dehydrogenase gamma chain
MVNVMRPADALTPGGVDCGLAAYIDRQLAGGFGKGARPYMRGTWREGKPQLGYQLPLTPEQFFKVGLAAADAACQTRNGKGFSELDQSGADRFLHEIADGKVTDERVQLASRFNELVYPLFEQACFADPIYGGNVGKVFWKVIGYPCLPAVHSHGRFPRQALPGCLRSEIHRRLRLRGGNHGYTLETSHGRFHRRRIYGGAGRSPTDSQGCRCRRP